MTRSPSKALIICNGESPTRAFARRLARASDCIVAADGGANVARRYGIRPDAIVGDLDSISRGTRRFFSSCLILHVPRQDKTDLEKALDFVAFRDIRKVAIIGVTGRRIDFTLGNLSVLWNYTSYVDLVVAGDGWFATPVGRAKEMRARVGTTVSLIPFGVCKGVTLRGLQYPLHSASMEVGEIGVSNIVTASPFRVEVKKGKMLLIVFGKRPR
jgi:thiamine pyrophosphokinase